MKKQERLCHYQGKFSVEATVEMIEEALKNLGIPLFAKFDHCQNAKDVGLTMEANTVLVFGAPKVGTALMVENPSFSLELPLRIAVWEGKDHGVWMAFPHMATLAKDYGLEESPIIEKMQSLLEKLVQGAGGRISRKHGNIKDKMKKCYQ